MSDPLYKREVLRLAANATGSGRLPDPCGTATAHNPTCGDKVVMDVALEDGRILALAHHTLACVLTQASASVLGAYAPGMSRDEVAALRDAVGAMLEGGPAPHAPFDSYAVFDGVADHPARHKCVLLPIDAALAALDSQKDNP
ncbi:MAG: iron-sulfur cluster assembly scaffold protein [Rhizomicrobium sp.]